MTQQYLTIYRSSYNNLFFNRNVLLKYVNLTEIIFYF